MNWASREAIVHRRQEPLSCSLCSHTLSNLWLPDRGPISAELGTLCVWVGKEGWGVGGGGGVGCIGEQGRGCCLLLQRQGQLMPFMISEQTYSCAAGLMASMA